MHPEKPEFESQLDPVLNTAIVLKMYEKHNNKYTKPNVWFQGKVENLSFFTNCFLSFIIK